MVDVFRNFEDTRKRLEAAETAFSKAQGAIEGFNTQCAKEIGDRLARFAELGLLPGTDKNDHRAESLMRSGLGVNFIYIRGENRPLGDISRDIQGRQLSEEIVAAARAKKIPVVLHTAGGHGIRVSEHVKEPEKHAVILLEALAAYAESKGKPKLAAKTLEAADRINDTISSLRERE